MKTKKRILFAIDAGFSGGKICVNRLVMNIPFAILQHNKLQDGDYSLRRADDLHIQCVYEGQSYTVGTSAKEYLLRSKKADTTDDSTQGFYTMARFQTKEFEVTLKTIMAYGLIKYAEYTAQSDTEETFSLEEIEQWDIFVGVTLPHSYYQTYRSAIREYLVGEDLTNPKSNELDVTIGTQKYNISFTVNPKIVCSSQCMDCIINELLDQNCNELTGEDAICGESNRPTLVIDGGYKTVGKALIDRDMAVVNPKSETEDAMMSINTEVANIISEYTDGYYDYMIDDLAKKEEIIHYLDENEELQSLDVKKLKNDATDKAAQKLLYSLCEEFNKLLKVKSILIAGGSGITYYPYIKEFCEEKRPYLANKIFIGCKNPANQFLGIELDNNKFTEKVIDDPIYAVVLGLYKEMCAKLENN